MDRRGGWALLQSVEGDAASEENASLAWEDGHGVKEIRGSIKVETLLSSLSRVVYSGNVVKTFSNGTKELGDSVQGVLMLPEDARWDICAMRKEKSTTNSSKKIKFFQITFEENVYGLHFAQMMFPVYQGHKETGDLFREAMIAIDQNNQNRLECR